MEKKISFIYANRNREVRRIKCSLESLANQTNQDFEVIFVDYGSQPEKNAEYKKLADTYNFLQVFFLPVSQLLWNKSKALNFGILKATSPIIFIADVDLIFHPESVDLLHKLKVKNHFWLFKLGYLNQQESEKLIGDYNFSDLKPERFGNINGMILSSRNSLMEVNGLDEFFHFYGAEDEDLFSRLELAGNERSFEEKEYFYHNFHQSFAGSEDKLLTGNPRIKNIMRINQRHFLRNRERKIVKPIGQAGMGVIINANSADQLNFPTLTFKIPNILAHIEHFLREELSTYQGEIVKVEFIEDPYFPSLKHKVKKILGKQSQPYCSMKQVNDIVLKEVLFRYRNSNYSFKIAEDLKSITFCVEV